MAKETQNQATMHFKDLKVLELASVLAGPSVGMFFSELGAKVTKIENKRFGGDVTRNWRIKGESKEGPSAYFCSVNWGKEHLFLDYSSEEDLKTVLNLASEADVVISNFKQGDDIKFGLDYPTIKKLNQNVIYAHLSGFHSEPDRVAFDVVLQAECGYMSMNGQKDSPPTKMPLALMDILAAHQMKEGILTALYKRALSGEGSYVDTSLEKSALASLANQAGNWLMSEHIPQRIGSQHPNIAPYGDTFITSDNAHVVLAIGSDKQFRIFAELIDMKLLPEYETNPKRVQNRAKLIEDLAKKLASWNSADLLAKCKDLKIPIGKVRNMKEVFENPTASEMVLNEDVDGYKTKRVSSIGFSLK